MLNVIIIHVNINVFFTKIKSGNPKVHAFNLVEDGTSLFFKQCNESNSGNTSTTRSGIQHL